MDVISSRRNPIITHMRALGRDRAYRRERGEYLCDGEKLLREALEFGAEVTCALYAPGEGSLVPEGVPAYRTARELLDYVSPLSNTPGPVFSCAIPEKKAPEGRLIILEGVQDPGNVGTVLRSAGAFGVGAVLLTGGCADPYNFKTVRAAMGATFRVPVLETELAFIRKLGVPVYGAALSSRAVSIAEAGLTGAAVAIGSEGRGLSAEMLELCAGEVIIPMAPGCESLNAAVAASIVMWELYRRS